MISARGVTTAAVVAAMMCVFLVSAASATVNIETVPVGYPGNAPDTTGYGAVDHNYRIGKYEVTVDQYTEFLNFHHHHSHLSFSPPQYFWNANHITQSGSGTTTDPYTYTVAPGYANNPVAYVSFWDACRFVNWLGNSQGQGDGDTESGAYTLGDYNGSAGGDISRNPGARWVIPTIDEWYKPAYGNDISNILSGGSEYFDDPTTASAYGTVDQYGNGWEWSESVGVANNLSTGRILGGGLVAINVDFKGSSLGDPSKSSGPSLPWVDYVIPSDNGGFGFRVAEVPEPATMSLLALGGLVALRRRR